MLQALPDLIRRPLFLALALPWLLARLDTHAGPLEFCRSKLLTVLVILTLVFCLPPIRIGVPASHSHAGACWLIGQPRSSFLICGIAKKKDRSGILIFVSLAERYARIIADEGIA